MEIVTFIIGFGLGIVFSMIILSSLKEDKKGEEPKYKFTGSDMCTKCGRRPKRWDNLCNACEDAKHGY